jgi:hypothetical protein
MMGMMNNSIYRVKVEVQSDTDQQRPEEIPRDEQRDQHERRKQLERKQREEAKLERLHLGQPRPSPSPTSAPAEDHTAGRRGDVSAKAKDGDVRSKPATSTPHDGAKTRPSLSIIFRHPVLPGSNVRTPPFHRW